MTTTNHTGTPMTTNMITTIHTGTAMITTTIRTVPYHLKKK